MAAIYCRACFHACDACCRACDGCCDAMSRCCESIGRTCQPCAKACTNTFCSPERPYPIFVTFTLLVTVVPLIALIVTLASDGVPTCSSPILVAQILLAVLGMIHLAFAFYINRKFGESRKEKGNAISRALKILLYDQGLFAYSLVYITSLVLTIVASTVWLVNESKCQNTPMFVMAEYMVMASYIYLIGGWFITTTSVCCECCRDDIPKDQTRESRSAARVGWWREERVRGPTGSTMSSSRNRGATTSSQQQQQPGVADKASAFVGGMLGRLAGTKSNKSGKQPASTAPSSNPSYQSTPTDDKPSYSDNYDV